MSNKCAPICFFPTTVIMVDDHVNYLNSLRLLLDSKQAMYRFYSDPRELLSYIESVPHVPAFLEECVKQEVDTKRGHRNIDINLYPIRDAVFNPKRFEQPSVIMIDQQMPGMKGLEVCEKLKDSPIRKVLLTGEVDTDQAVKAFNDGRIHKFISKGDRNFKELVFETVIEQQQIYMQHVTAPVRNAITQLREGYRPSCLIDPAFIELLERIIKEHNICEYYLSDDNGSYTFFDAHGKPSWLVLKDKDEIEADFYLGDDSEDPPSKEVLQGLKEGKLILHLYTEDEERNIEPVDWQKAGLIYPATALKGATQTYYYAYIKNPDVHDISKNTIVSFEKAKDAQG